MLVVTFLCHRQLAKPSWLAHGKKRWDIILQDNPISIIFFFFGFEENLSFRNANSVSMRVAFPIVCRKYNIYYYIINHLKNICIAVATQRGKAIKRYKLWKAYFNNLFGSNSMITLMAVAEQCGFKILFLKEMCSSFSLCRKC